VRTLRHLVCLTLFAGLSAPAWAHGPMFEDYFKFDDSNGGESLTQEAVDAMRAEGLVPTLAALTPCAGGTALGLPCRNVDLQAFLAKGNMGAASNINLNDIWGWTDPVSGREFALVGLTNATSFVEVTDPANPRFIGILRSHTLNADGTPRSSSWRDIKVYRDHAFIVADSQAGHGMQVFDLRQLLVRRNNAVAFPETAHLPFGAAHNIAINEDTGYAYAVGTSRNVNAGDCGGGLLMIDISNPQSPVRAGCFSADGYTHDAQCVVYNGPDRTYLGREICVAYNEDTVTIVDVTNKQAPRQISRTPYAGSSYTHQGWFLNSNHEIIITNDELDERNTPNGQAVRTTSYLFDVRDLDNPRELGRYRGPTAAIDHNLYTVQNPISGRDVVVEANYSAGIRILTTANVGRGVLREAGFFDVIANNNATQFVGTWSSYLYFPSGNIIASDIGGGLFVLRPDWAAIDQVQ